MAKESNATSFWRELFAGPRSDRRSSSHLVDRAAAEAYAEELFGVLPKETKP
jgi:hypothetical protein